MPSSQSARKRQSRRLSKHTVFWTVTLITIGLFLVSCLAAFWATERESIRQLSDACSTGWKLGFGSILTLLGTRSGA